MDSCPMGEDAALALARVRAALSRAEGPLVVAYGECTGLDGQPRQRAPVDVSSTLARLRDLYELLLGIELVVRGLGPSIAPRLKNRALLFYRAEACPSCGGRWSDAMELPGEIEFSCSSDHTWTRPALAEGPPSIAMADDFDRWDAKRMEDEGGG